jgi:hypothetical protein
MHEDRRAVVDRQPHVGRWAGFRRSGEQRFSERRRHPLECL